MTIKCKPVFMTEEHYNQEVKDIKENEGKYNSKRLIQMDDGRIIIV